MHSENTVYVFIVIDPSMRDIQIDLIDITSL